MKKTVLFVFLCMQLIESYPQIKFVNSNNEPLYCKVQYKLDGKLVEIDTNQDGFLDIKEICKGNNMVNIIPYNRSYSETELYCPSNKKKVRILSKHQWSTLVTNFKLYTDFENEKKYLAYSILAGNEIAATYRLYNNSTVADSVSKSVYKLAAKYFDIPINEALYQDKYQEIHVISQSFKNALVAYQKKNDLPAHGILGWRTIASMAETQPIEAYTSLFFK